MENKGEVCLEEEVDRMRRLAKSTTEIAQEMGVDPSWVESLVFVWKGGDHSGESRRRNLALEFLVSSSIGASLPIGASRAR